MKAFAVVLLCLFAAVQGRSTGAQARTEAQPGENPWVVHLRVAVSTSGFLNSCVGTLISNSWVLTSANCVKDVRFVWIRYGAVNVIRPDLVTETSAVRVHPDFNAETGENDVALISINRFIETTDTIKPVELASADAEDPASGKFCGYGAAEDNITPGETLSCFDVDVEASEDGSLVANSEDGAATRFDIGGALVSDGVQYGVLVGYPGDEDTKAGVFTKVSDYLDWINSEVNPSSGYELDDGYGSEVYIVN